ncbi:MAG: hypothetical protein ACK4SZ_08205 [Allosphingosinicella sp.]|uniref:hypothetical protein n=1 Tax=Allosphingosinicella sp. TaxID=2823234 RepID=UPI0039422ED2
MRLSGSIAFAPLLLLASCGGGTDATETPANGAGNDSAPTTGPAAAQPGRPSPGQGWDLQSSGEGSALVLLSTSGEATVRLFCQAADNRLLVNVPGFRAVGSEERMSVGSGGEVVALVADTRGDRQRGGVTGAGDVPANLAALIAGPVAVNYGAQNSGPHPAPPAELARGFVAACTDRAPSGDSPARPGGETAGVSPCLIQGSERLQVAPLRAVGTEPFWGARIEGRCVTYSHPDDQSGTRVWTRYTPTATGGTWSGALGGRRFELTTRAAPGCSDGMSDRRYPIAVDLLVGGERRRGCAAPL